MIIQTHLKSIWNHSDPSFLIIIIDNLERTIVKNNSFSEPGTVIPVLDLLVPLPIFMDQMRASMLLLQPWKVKLFASLKSQLQMKMRCKNASEKSNILCQEPCLLSNLLCIKYRGIFAEIGSMAFAMMDFETNHR